MPTANTKAKIQNPQEKEPADKKNSRQQLVLVLRKSPYWLDGWLAFQFRF